jgi:hypothetical protein
MNEEDGKEVLEYVQLPSTVRFGEDKGFAQLLLGALIGGFDVRFYRAINMPSTEFCCIVSHGTENISPTAHSIAHRTPGGALADAILRWKRNYSK